MSEARRRHSGGGAAEVQKTHSSGRRGGQVKMDSRKSHQGTKIEARKRSARPKRRGGRRIDSGGEANTRWRISGGGAAVVEVQNKRHG